MEDSSKHTKSPGLVELTFYYAETDNKNNKPTEKVNYTTGEKSVSVTEKRESR